MKSLVVIIQAFHATSTRGLVASQHPLESPRLRAALGFSWTLQMRSSRSLVLLGEKLPDLMSV